MAELHIKGLMPMCIVLIRAVILYILVIFAVRLMGKRQLGELQPSELVITILVSNIATLPLEDVSIPLSVGVTPILALVCFEVITSWLSLKIPNVRRIISGRPKIIISNGRIDSEVMRDLRFSVDDLMTALRGNGIFRIDEVQYAIVETTGSVSVMKKTGDDTPVRNDLGIESVCSDPPQVIISDGRIMEKAMISVGIDVSGLKKILDGKNLKCSDIYIMTADTQGNYFISEKEDKRHDKG
jgi:uncharacterized membrane protein YcaP (DUF421 family)